MPFFLVTQTSLVEGEDEVSAAEKALRQIRDADKVAFSVKFDEHTITKVSVSAPGKMLEATASASAYPLRACRTDWQWVGATATSCAPSIGP